MLRRTTIAILAAGTVLACTPACSPYSRSSASFVPTPTTATVVFMRGSWGSGYGFVYEGDEFLGVTGPGTRFEVSVAPGDHVFAVVGGENLDFMSASLEPAQTYHATIRVAPGFAAMRMYFQARNEQGDTATAYASTAAMTPNERGVSQAEKYRARKNKLYPRSWAKWSELPESKKSHLHVPTRH